MPSPTPATKTKYFYPRPPRGGRQGDARQVCKRDLISIHALREEGDIHYTTGRVLSQEFLSTPSARRATWQTSANKPF